MPNFSQPSHKITPFLWFDTEAEAAMNFYISVFKNSRVLSTSRYPDAMPGRGGTLMAANFELDGQQFTALNAGPDYTFTEAVSFFVSCDSQDEVDDFWTKLTADGGEAGQCGWLKDKFGLSWQIVPSAMGDLLGDPDPEKASRTMTAMMAMHKLDLPALKRAHDGEPA
ncbi:VOC family protein [Candidatus Saccharibacteria bacterium]|nr:VOC family protein [Candidatus Saccharibacteria bacterium]